MHGRLTPPVGCWERQRPLTRMLARDAADGETRTVTPIDRPHCGPRLEARPLASLKGG
jgi:hypothetical protein